MQQHKQLLLENKAWAQDMLDRNPEVFEKMSQGQKPNFLWIGCSDSRVAPDEICQTRPGEMFIHRNVANVVVHTDMNLLSVLQYAVEVLEIKHIIVCGHYGCGGVLAAMGNKSFGLIDTWLRHIKDVYRLHAKELDAIEDETQRANRLVELNVREQMYNIAKSTIIQKSWKNNQRPSIHGWIYRLHDGILEEKFDMEPGAALPAPVYEYDSI